MLKTLFDPTTESFQRLSPALLSFKDKFANYYLGNGNRAQRTGEVNNEELEELIQTLIDGDVELYMPYIYEEMLETNHFTIVAATLENQGDNVEGYRVELNNQNSRNSQPFQPVTVNDDYADNNPTFVIMPIDDSGSWGGGSPGDGSNGDDSSNGDSQHPHEYEDLYRMLVKVGAIRCNEQYDALVSLTGNGRGSEFQFVRAYPYFSGGTKSHISEVGVTLTRRQINRYNTVNVNASWDNAWDPEELTQGLGIYEFDNTNNKSITLDGTVELLRNGNVSTATYSEEFPSKDPVLLNEDLGRENFYYDSEDERDFGNGLHNGYAWRTAGSLQFTLAPTMEYE